MLKIKSDSRKVNKGDTFIALKGIDSDGHNYIEKALENGASKIIAQHGDYEVETIIVPNTRLYLENYLKEKYKNILNKMKIIGVTGTNGKTTVSYLLYQSFNLLGKKTAYAGTIGFYIESFEHDLLNTTPDIIDIYEMIVKAYNKGCQNFIIEVSSHAGEQGRVKGIEFDYLFFTNLTRDHLDYHKTFENYVLAKQKIFKQLKSTGYGVVNIDDSYKNYFLSNQSITYGFKKSIFQILDYNISNQMMKFKFLYNNKTTTIKTKLLGKHNVYNLMSVIGLLINEDVSLENIKKIILKLNPPSGRMENIKYEVNNIIIDYAHTPDAMDNIINTVKKFTLGKLYIVFGCTGERDRTKRPIMTEIALSSSNYSIITNEDPYNEDPNQIVCDMLKENTRTNYEIILDRKLAIQKGIDLLEKNDTLLILGKGHEQYININNKKIPFSDQKTVLEYIKNK